MKKTLLHFKTVILITFLASGFNTFSQTVDLIANVDVTPPLTTGQTFTYTIDAIAGTTPYRGLQIYLDYNESVIQLNSLTPDNSDLPFLLNNDTNTPGEILYSAGNITDVSGTTNVFTAVFEVISTSESVMIEHRSIADDSNGTSVANAASDDVTGITNDIILSTLSVDQTEFSNSISIFPNPVNDVLNIRLKSSSTAIDNIKLFSIDGKLVQQYDANSIVLKENLVSLDTSKLDQTLYLLTITSAENEITTFKIVVN